MNDYINNAFTREGENTNLEINNLNVGCITSTNNNFELDSNGNLVVKTLKAESILEPTILNTFYPVGSIYMSTNGTNPGGIFGGVWEQIKDKFLLGCGDNYVNGSEGGEATHKLTQEEMPIHKHYNYFRWFANGSGEGFNNWGYTVARAKEAQSDDTGNVAAGGDMPHNNMPPYLAVYIWKRVS